MPVADSQVRKTGPWPLGIGNLQPETSPLKAADGSVVSLREATNVDLDSSGVPSLRAGYTQAVAGTDVHSCWSDDYLPWGLYVDSTGLRAVHPDISTELLVDGLAPGLPVSYCRINTAVVWTNGTQRGQVNLDLEATNWSCPYPNNQVDLAVQDGGALDQGTYNVTATYVDKYGRESGAPLAATIDVPNNSYIDITNIPQPGDTDAVPYVRIYATGGNDGALRAVATLPAGTPSYQLDQRPTGKPLETLFLRPLPAGQLTCAGNGRQFVARNSTVCYSPALRYGLYNPAHHRVSFNGRITMMAFVGDGSPGAGLYVSDSKRVYFLAGADPAEWKQVIASPYSVVPGAFTTVAGDLVGLDSPSPVPVWLSANGFLSVGAPGGQIVVLKEHEAVIDQAESGALMFREQAGTRQLVAALKGNQPSPLAVRDQMIVREYRNTA